jgi:cobyrinic acid a,c-diamide synthase
MKHAFPRIVIAATGSGAGKTSVTIGLVAALRARGLRVQTFKMGPDFLDPSYLAQASGRPCYNLDGWMCGREYVTSLFARAAYDADIAIIEGAMGLFDGAVVDALTGSTAEIAQWLDAPVAMVVDAKGASRSFAATAYGFTHFEPTVAATGFIANHCGSVGHGELLKKALEAAGLPPLLGALRAGCFPGLTSRHLGLVSAEVNPLSETALAGFRQGAEQNLCIDAIVHLARSALLMQDAEPPATRQEPVVRIAVARDAAFHFYYPDNLQALENAGAELAYFSPLDDSAVPEACGGLYVGGGYPEAHAATLAANTPMLRSIRDFASARRPVYAECGGLMYLSQGIEDRDGRRHALVGLLPVWTRMLTRLKALGYVEAVPLRDSLFEREGGVLRGHEFHYSEIIESGGEQSPEAYQLSKARRTTPRLEGFHLGNTLASYAHIHFASHPGAASRFVRLAWEALHGTE